MKIKMKIKEYVLLDKAIFFPKSKILAIGDLQIGYEQMLKQETGLSIPINQLNRTAKDIKSILEKIEKMRLKAEKIILLGDIKHHFSYNVEEKFAVRDFLEFLENKLKNKKNLILIKGNHEKFHLDKKIYRDFHIEGKVAFLHGHKNFPQIWDKKIKTIVMAHLHPAVCITDRISVKKEKYKCFLVGKYKNKTIIILPSFFPIIKGTCINYDSDNKTKKEFSIIPKNKLKNFNVYIQNKKSGRALNFGKLKNLN